MAVFLKILSRVCFVFAIIVVSLTAWIIWGPLGPMIVEPLVRRYGESAVPALRVESVEGSLYSGVTLNGVSLTSGDKTLLEANRLMIRPSWGELRQGAIWLSDLELYGVRANVENLSTLALRYGGKSGESSAPSIKPIRVTLRDITFDTPMYQIEIDEGLLAMDGSLALSADLGGLPVCVSGHLDFDQLQALSLDVSIGSGRAFLEGKLTEPLDIKGGLHSVKLGELMAVLPGFSTASGEGDIEGRFNVMGAGEHLGAWGSLYLNNGSVAGLPAEMSTSWSYKGGDFSLSNTKVKAMSADMDLKVSADLRPVPTADRFMARGTVRGVSMKNLERLLSLDVSLDGDNGIVDFWVSADLAGKTAGKVFVRLPDVKADGAQVIKGLRANVLFSPDGVTVDGTAEAFGAKLTGAGDGSIGRNGSFTMALGTEAGSALSLAGVKLEGLNASARYENGLITLDALRARIGKAPLNLAGTLSLTT